MSLQPDARTAVPDSALVRSRSRYKGHRPKRPAAPQTQNSLPEPESRHEGEGNNTLDDLVGHDSLEVPSPRLCGDIGVFPRNDGPKVLRNEPSGQVIGVARAPTRLSKAVITNQKQSSGSVQPSQFRRARPRDPSVGHNQQRSVKPSKSSGDASSQRPAKPVIERAAGRYGSVNDPDTEPVVPAPSKSKPKLFGSTVNSRLKWSRDSAPKDTVRDELREHDLQNNGKPAFDAPVSAVNAGERRAAVEYQKSVISVSITPSTTAMDVVRAAGAQLGVSLSPSTTVVLESFRQLGLERPLRRYEHVRDVLNSWDFDAQNALIIVPSRTGGKDGDLEAQSVPKQQPGDASLQIYHSQRPRHWQKQIISLRGDGQMLTTKKGVVTAMCHLSDFDIYVPTKRQLSKKIKPPKKLCFAIKSQQKSTMFMSTENFVHFFSTSDRELAEQWYATVRGWRSWYLVNVMGEGRETTSMLEGTVDYSLKNPLEPGTQKPAMGPSVDSSNPKQQPCTPPVIHRSSKGPSISSNIATAASRSLATQKDTRDSGISGRLRTAANTTSPQPGNQEPFAPTGLLGRSYTQRKKAQEEHSSALKDSQGVETMVDSKSPVNARRGSSQHGKPMPLLDLNTQIQRPPQYRVGKGVTPDQVPAGGLVEVATTPERAIQIPPVSEWKQVNEPQIGTKRSSTVRSRYNRNAHIRPTERQESASPQRTFFSKGLLCTENPSQGSIGHGRGVRTGDRTAKESMMDLRDRSQYLPGSLLASVEKSEGRNDMHF